MVKTSERTRKYNCIAWAAGDTEKWWWPLGFYWPSGIPKETTLEAFIALFKSLGYEDCYTPELETGYTKVALFCKQDSPTHAARQLEDGFWTSKLGEEIDVRHEFNELATVPQLANLYGDITFLMKKKNTA